MSGKPLSVVLPLLDATSPASAVLNDHEIAGYGGVVSRDGDAYRLLVTDDLIALASLHGDATAIPLAMAQGLPMKQLTTRAVLDAGFDFLNPRVDTIQGLFRYMQTQVILGPLVHGLSGHSMVTALDARIIRRRYTCSFGKETYDEKEYVLYSGKCPDHLTGTLS